MRSLSKNYIDDLLQAVRHPSAELSLLKDRWSEIEDLVSRKREELERRIGPDDPIRLSIDLLGPIGCASKETVHTQALAYLFDESKPHGFGRHVLRSVIDRIRLGAARRAKMKREGTTATEQVRERAVATAASYALRAINQTGSKTKVIPEYRFKIEGDESRSIGRCDICVQIFGNLSSFIIFENKIRAPESNEQLKFYEKESRYSEAVTTTAAPKSKRKPNTLPTK